MQAEAKLPVEPEEFQESFKPFLMDVIFQWSKVLATVILYHVYCRVCGVCTLRHVLQVWKAV